jgi:hypothetical protein
MTSFRYIKTLEENEDNKNDDNFYFFKLHELCSLEMLVLCYFMSQMMGKNV